MGERQVVSVEHQGDQYTTRWNDSTSDETAGGVEDSTRRAIRAGLRLDRVQGARHVLWTRRP